jgi:succinyl-diaminopimelate desuccinylase
MAGKLDAYLDRQAGAIARFVRQLVVIPTVNPPGENYLRFVTSMQPWLESLGMRTRIVRVPTAQALGCVAHAREYPRASLLGRLDVKAPRSVHFNCHYDVVPAAGQWRSDPFDPRVRGGWIYGRGTSDMKGAIASISFALQALRDLKIQPRMNIELSLTPDEETGGDLGAGYLVREGHVRADYAVVCEGGSGREVGCGHNGVLWLQAAVQGRAAHASHPEVGINAFEKMAALVMRLQPLKKKLSRRVFRLPDGKKMSPTLSIGGVFGVGPGAKENTVPALATFSMDRRITPGERLPDAQKELRGAIAAAGKRIPQLKVEVSRLLAIDPCHLDPTAALPQAFAGAVRAVQGGKVGFGVSSGFTDMHFFARDGKIPTVGYGPGGRNYHAIDEAARIEDLVACAKVYAGFMAGWDGGEA